MTAFLVFASRRLAGAILTLFLASVTVFGSIHSLPGSYADVFLGALGAELIGDFNPHHVDDEYAKASRFGTRILHGVLTSALMGGPVGMHFHGTAMAYLEHAARFMAPVRPGDTLSTQWIVIELHPKPHKQCGVVVMAGVCRNQHGEIIGAFAPSVPGMGADTNEARSRL
jgi:acyl dehydratase